MMNLKKAKKTESNMNDYADLYKEARMMQRKYDNIFLAEQMKFQAERAKSIFYNIQKTYYSNITELKND